MSYQTLTRENLGQNIMDECRKIQHGIKCFTRENSVQVGSGRTVFRVFWGVKIARYC